MMIRAIPVTIPTKVNMIPPLLSFSLLKDVNGKYFSRKNGIYFS
jgi:hypothetical protein